MARGAGAVPGGGCAAADRPGHHGPGARRAGPATTDGPFAETKEQLGGYYVIEAENLDRAIEAAARCPGAEYGTIEVRPLMDDVGTRDRTDHRQPRGRRPPVPARVGTGGRDAHPDPGRLRPRGGGRAGGVRGRARALAGRRRSRTTPGAWITTTARNRAIDRLRRERRLRERTDTLGRLAELEALGDDMTDIPDERLRLIFTCCHPALAARRPRRPHPADRRRAVHAARSRARSW